MAVVEGDARAGSTAGTSRPAAATRLFAALAGMDWLSKVWWTCLSVGLFAGSGTSTPTLQAALAASGSSDPAIKQQWREQALACVSGTCQHRKAAAS